MSRRKFIGVCLLALLLPLAALAQTATTASLAGAVRDANSAVVAGATVKLTNKATKLNQAKQHWDSNEARRPANLFP